MASDILYLGTKGHLAAIDKSTGTTVWKTQLKGGFTSSTFVTVLVDGSRVFAHTAGQLFCVDASTGRVLWRNDLPGLGYDIANLAMEGVSTSVTTGAAARAQQAARSSAASTT